MNLIEKLDYYSRNFPTDIAYINKNSQMTFEELGQSSDALASYLLEKYPDDKTPIVVVGHKSKWMLLCFLGCVKAGHAYIPVDTSMPSGRIEEIIAGSKTKLIFSTEDLPYSFDACTEIVNKDRIYRLSDDYSGKKPDKDKCVKSEDVYYIIFTSGSTGKPKGVRITLKNLESFISWGLDFCHITENRVFMNQAPFSFDLSVMDLYLSLASKSTLVALDKDLSSDMGRLFDIFRLSDISVWVSTPSFADMCLADKSFSETLLPKLKTFLFCGETLTNKTVENLHARFSDCAVYNLYGPTEATVAVTQVLITETIVKNINPLPVGKVKPGCKIYIMRDGKPAADGESGEIVITGDSVSRGYYNDEEMTAISFGYFNINGESVFGYKTGDLGYFSESQLYYFGRLDFQIKLNGYRIEIEDIENNFRKLPEIQNAVVIPVIKERKTAHLNAFVIMKDPNSDKSLKASIEIKKKLNKLIPEYMIPKKIIFKDSFKFNANGKIDRKALTQEV